MRRLTSRLTPLFLALAGALIVVSSALAFTPPKLTGQITDSAGRVDASDPAIASAIDALRSGHGINLRVLLTDSMEGVEPGEYTKAVANFNLLGNNEALLAITFSDRKFGIWVGDGVTRINDAEIDAVLNGAVAQHLRSGDTKGAIVAAADALGAADSGTVAEPTLPPAPVITPVPVPTKPLDLSWVAPALMSIAGLLAALFFVYFAVMALMAFLRSRNARRALSAKMRSLMDSSAATIVSTDEELKAALQEADFIASEFDAPTAAPFKAALEPLSAQLSETFTQAAKLQDAKFAAPAGAAVSDGNAFDRYFTRGDATPIARANGYQQILEEAGEVSAAIKGPMAEMRKLRDLESTLSARLPGVQVKLAAAQAAIASAEPRLAALKARSPKAAAVVETNIRGADELVELAAKDLAIATDNKGGKGEDTLALVRCEGRLAKIDVLIAAIDTMASEVAAAEKALSGHLKEAAAEITRASNADTRDDVKGEEKDVRAAQSKLDAARRLAESDAYAADAMTLEALRAADDVIGEVRDAVAARQRKEAAAREALAGAKRSITEAESYINSHRSVVSAGARSRLERANAQIGSYREGMDPLELYLALSILQSIQSDAQSAYRSARSDVSAHEAAERARQDSYTSSHDTFGGGISMGGGGGISSGGGWGGGGGHASGGGW